MTPEEKSYYKGQKNGNFVAQIISMLFLLIFYQLYVIYSLETELKDVKLAAKIETENLIRVKEWYSGMTKEERCESNADP